MDDNNTEALKSEREKFEKWYELRHDAVDFTLRDDGQYDDWDIALQWNAWQARAALPSVQVPPWISVEERLPEIDFSKQGYARNVRVLAAWGSEPGNVAEMSYSSNAYAKTEKGREPRFEHQGRISPWKVTHWQPLPPPPAAPSSQGDSK